MREIWDNLAQASGLALAFMAALIGRAMATAVQRPALGWGLLWEIPIVIGMGLIGAGVSEYLHIYGNQAAALIAVAGYLGPTGIVPLCRVLLKKP
jgi:hypothetical protein